MTALGPVLLPAALAIAVYGVAASIYGVRARRPAWVQSGRRAVYALAAVLTLAFAILEAAFLRSDFSLAVVAEHSSTTTPAFYRAAAAWSAQEGSLLLWVWLLSLWSSAALFASRGRMRDVAAYAQAVLLGFAGFFTALLVFLADPFQPLHPTPHQGLGLNPLLRHPSMMIHPPLLYSGYTLFTIPFAFAVGALITRRLDAEWIRTIRRFAPLAWLCLGFGILLGARWSYAELGWGGYWAWDPVENASLMPWLTGTAFLHSFMVQERRGILKAWNVSLVLATGILAILGTFLVRSGILDSIHAFGASSLGLPFLAFIAVLLFGSIALVVSRADDLRSEGRIDSLLSRETAFLAQQPRARRPLLRDLLGDVLPTDLRGAHRHAIERRTAVVRPLHRAVRAAARAARRASARRCRGAGSPAPASPTPSPRRSAWRSSSHWPCSRSEASLASRSPSACSASPPSRSRLCGRSSGAALARGARSPASGRRSR